MVINNQTLVAPVMQLPIGASYFQNTGSTYYFISKYYNTSGFNLTFNTSPDSFTKFPASCTLAVYNGTNASAAQAFDGSNCNFYFDPAGTVYNYQIINNGSSKTLIITNTTTGNKIYYNNDYIYLGTNDNILKKSFKIYPNPAKDFLTIENIDRNLNLKIYDVSGKLIYETLTSGKSVRVDISHFQKGQYILMIENSRPEFFIKD